MVSLQDSGGVGSASVHSERTSEQPSKADELERRVERQESAMSCRRAQVGKTKAGLLTRARA